ncbi:hypothetical protein G6F56_002623 [Rhizopus delemar]|nr:hypothetical protein G6F56_002623 [Rhizopus delemar]
MLNTIKVGPFFSNQLSAFINVQAKEADLKGNMERAKDECCQITAPVSSEEAKAVLDALNSLAPELDKGVNSFVRKQIELKSFDFIQKNFKDTLNLIGDWMVPTDNCIITFSSPDVSNDIQLTITNAAFVGKRDKPVESIACGIGISKIRSTFADLKPLANKERLVEEAVKSSTADCCRVTNYVTPDESNGLARTYHIFSFTLEFTFNSIINKKTELTSNEFFDTNIKDDIQFLREHIGQLDACVIGFTPNELVSNLQGFVVQVNGIFAKIMSTFGIE